MVTRVTQVALVMALGLSGCDSPARVKPWRHAPDPTSEAARVPSSPALASDTQHVIYRWKEQHLLNNSSYFSLQKELCHITFIALNCTPSEISSIFDLPLLGYNVSQTYRCWFLTHSSSHRTMTWNKISFTSLYRDIVCNQSPEKN